VEKALSSLAQTLRLAHEALLRDLHGLEAAGRAEAQTSPAEMGMRLRRTRAHLTDHFRFEEQNGYLDVVLRRDPNRERTVERLHDDHRRLAEELERLLEDTAEQRPGDALLAKVRAWVESVRDHEARENALVQDAFNVEPVAED
jgi:hypothetical protein